MSRGNITFEELKNFDKFKIEGEEEMFYKDSNRYDGAINAYIVKNTHLAPVIFGKDQKVIKVE